jgi:hypothetical protein
MARRIPCDHCLAVASRYVRGMTTKSKAPGQTAGTRAGGAGVPAAAPSNVPSACPTADQSVADFVAKIKALAPHQGANRGRLVFAMDATMSRQPTWDMALSLQAGMFHAVKDVGGLDVQLTYFRGAGECRASKWVSDPDELARLMTTVTCRGGTTQIGKVLTHAKAESAGKRVNALVYVGDAMEEAIDPLCASAGELGLLGVPVFLFQEGHDVQAERAFKEIAQLTNGATCRFDAGSAQQLRDLLTAVAVYAAGGQAALVALSQRGKSQAAQLLLTQMKPGG